MSNDDKTPEQVERKIDGLNAYDILRMPECPIKLPTARSMTQARIDYYHWQDAIIKWYIENKRRITSKKD